MRLQDGNGFADAEAGSGGGSPPTSTWTCRTTPSTRWWSLQSRQPTKTPAATARCLQGRVVAASAPGSGCEIWCRQLLRPSKALHDCRSMFCQDRCAVELEALTAALQSGKSAAVVLRSCPWNVMMTDVLFLNFHCYRLFRWRQRRRLTAAARTAMTARRRPAPAASPSGKGAVAAALLASSPPGAAAAAAALAPAAAEQRHPQAAEVAAAAGSAPTAATATSRRRRESASLPQRKRRAA